MTDYEKLCTIRMVLDVVSICDKSGKFTDELTTVKTLAETIILNNSKLCHINPCNLNADEMALLGFAVIDSNYLMLIPRWMLPYISDDFETVNNVISNKSFVNKNIYITHLMIAVRPMDLSSKQSVITANNEHLKYLKYLNDEFDLSVFETPIYLFKEFNLTVIEAHWIVSFWAGMSFNNKVAL